MAVARAPLSRLRRGKVVAGVAAGLGERLGVSPTAIRALFVVLALAGGLGLVLYLLAWLLMPVAERSAATGPPAHDGHDNRPVVAVAMVVLGALLLLRQTSFWFDDAVVWPVTISAIGLYVIWRQAAAAPAADRGRALLTRLVGTGGAAAGARLVAGVLLVAAGVTLFLAANNALDAARQGLLATAAVIFGLALVFLPWWARLAQDLGEERRARIRSQARAELAAHLHDSVLQTLTLIQRNAADSRTVSALARQQERELRSWLYAPRPAHAAGQRLAAALQSAGEEVEDRYGVTVETVTVGDCPLDDRLSAVVAAAREALTNAARHSQADVVSLYGEVEPTRVMVFVRDRGQGFDEDAVPSDRRGIADSIVGRMASNGGRATVRTRPGKGTEVELVMPRAAA